MSSNLIIIKAKIHLKSTEEGGRKSGIKSGYRPNHVFEYSNDGLLHTYIGDIHFDDREFIQPGETKIVTVRFIRVPGIEPYMTIGRKWFLHEGAFVVGEGEILEINQK